MMTSVHFHLSLMPQPLKIPAVSLPPALTHQSLTQSLTPVPHTSPSFTRYLHTSLYTTPSPQSLTPVPLHSPFTPVLHTSSSPSPSHLSVPLYLSFHTCPSHLSIYTCPSTSVPRTSSLPSSLHLSLHTSCFTPVPSHLSHQLTSYLSLHTCPFIPVPSY